MIDSDGICLISFSDNCDHQEVLYSLYEAMISKAIVYTIGITDPKITNPPKGKNNYYVDCPKRPGITKKTFRFDLLKKVTDIIRKLNVKYIYFESMHVWNIMLMLSLPKTIICIEAVHDILPHNNSFVRKECQRIATRLSSGVVIHNKIGIAQMSEVYGLTKDKIQYIPSWRPFPTERPISENQVFLNFGRIRKYKGLDALIEIISKTPDVSYRIVGSPDEESMPQVERLNTMKNVTVDAREVDASEMEDYFVEASWVILPYESASQSGVIMDAYRYSRPVIAFDVGAISEQIHDGETGFLVPAGDVNAFVDTINKAIRLSTDEQKSISHNAYLFGKHVYGAEQIVDEFLRIVGNVENKKKQ